MKKIITVLMVLMVATSMFAYIPKKDCVKVKRNKIKYYEKTEVWNLLAEEPDPKDTGFFGDSRNYEAWFIDKDMTVERSIDINYKFLEKYREGYRKKMECVKEKLEKTKHIDLENVDDSLKNSKEWNIILGTNYTDKEIYIRHMLRFAKICEHEASNYKKTALISIPFTTEENWLTITKEEMLTKMKAFVEEVKQNTK